MSRFTNFTYRRYALDNAAPQHEGVAEAQYVGTKGDDNIHGRKTTDTINGLGGDDILNGRYGDDTLDGGKENDVLKGSAGGDILNGGAGDDVLYGGTEQQERDQGGFGRDQLFGGSGDDSLYGGWEADTLEGGSGNDRFVYSAFSDSTIELSDVIRDFDSGKDKLVFEGEFSTDLTLKFIGKDQLSGTPGEVRFAYNSESSVVLIDLDGNGIADFSIDFVKKIHFQASDFSF